MELKRNRDDDALRELAAARSFYSAQGMPVYTADVDALISQALRRKSDIAEVIELGESVIRTIMEFKSDERAVLTLWLWPSLCWRPVTCKGHRSTSFAFCPLPIS